VAGVKALHSEFENFGMEWNYERQKEKEVEVQDAIESHLREVGLNVVAH
jgi:hypothetical protein